jgi:hypothetical protein
MLFHILFGHKDPRRRTIKRLKQVLETLEHLSSDPKQKILQRVEEVSLLKSDIIWAKENASQTDTDRIPQPLWEKVVLLGFKLITGKFEDFSFSLYDIPEEDLLAEEVIPEIEKIIRQVEDVLFAQPSFYEVNIEESLIAKLKQELIQERKKLKEYESILGSFAGKIATKLSQNTGKK